MLLGKTAKRIPLRGAVSVGKGHIKPESIPQPDQMVRAVMLPDAMASAMLKGYLQSPTA